MSPRCEVCKLDFRQEPGFYLGSIYFNYGLTALIVTAAYFTLYFAADLPDGVLLGGLTAFCVLFPLWFFRYARSLWLGVDQYFDPDPLHVERNSFRSRRWRRHSHRRFGSTAAYPRPELAPDDEPELPVHGLSDMTP